MPFEGLKPAEPTPAEVLASQSEIDAIEAIKGDADPEYLHTESDNLVVVEDGKPAPEQGNPFNARLRVGLGLLLQMNKLEILAVGLDRGYWAETGVLGLSTEDEIRAFFVQKQSEDETLEDE